MRWLTSFTRLTALPESLATCQAFRVTLPRVEARAVLLSFLSAIAVVLPDRAAPAGLESNGRILLVSVDLAGTGASSGAQPPRDLAGPRPGPTGCRIGSRPPKSQGFGRAGLLMNTERGQMV